MPKQRGGAAIVFINGWGQGAGPGEGLYRLYDWACDRWYDQRRDLVLYRTHNGNHAETADLIQASGAVHIALTGYSRGAGRGCTELAAALADRGRVVDQMFLIDPVPRYRLIPANFLSLTRLGTYEVPANVLWAMSWRQVNKRGPFDPVGHKIKPVSEATKIAGEFYLGTKANLEKHVGHSESNWIVDYTVHHSNIDDHPRIHERVIASIAQKSPPPEPMPCAA